MKKIAVFDTTVSNYNLGNQIIMDAVYKHLKGIFPMDFFFKLPYMEITENTLKYIGWSDLVFFGGTNSLCGEMDKYTQWGLNKGNYKEIKNVILMGMGWWQYQDTINRYTRKILTASLSSTFIHSVRDSYTEKKLRSIGFENVTNTGCPTLWDLTERHCEGIKKEKSEEVVFTVTDYMQNLGRDRAIFDVLKRNYSRIHMWIQGMGDYDYIKKNFDLQNIEFVGPDLEYYDDLLATREVDYVGTRLHAGIRALQFKRRATIIGIDNRALEMRGDFNIPVVPECEIYRLDEIIRSAFDIRIALPCEQIRRWKSQF